MRRLILTGIFCTLAVALIQLWQHRFERSPEFPTYRLADLRSQSSMNPAAGWSGDESNPAVTLRADQQKPPAVAVFEFPGIRAVSVLHLRYHISSRKLEPGRKKWEDGRGIIEWHSGSDAASWENNGFTSIRKDASSEVTACVLRPETPPAVPVLRLENLGISGEMTFSMLEATVLRERMIWKIGRWILMAAWIAWVAACIGPLGKWGWLRPVLAGLVSLLMVIYFVVPGPWKILHPLGGKFQIGPEIQNLQIPAFSPHSWNHPAPKLESVGKLPDQGDIILRIKHLAEHFRPFLHSLLLFAPALVVSCLIGWRRMVPLMVLLALAIEAAQVRFGYGFDWLDAFDLFNDSVGIALAVWVYHQIRKTKSGALVSLLEP